MSGKKRTRSKVPEIAASTPQPPPTPVVVIERPGEDHLPTVAETRSSRSQWIWVLAPMVLAILGSLNTLWNGWVADDDTQIVKNVALQKLNNIPNSFTSSVWSYATSDILFTVDTYYRPFFMTLFTINYAVVGLAPWGWHLINLLIHASATLLVFITIRELTQRPEIAGITASLFAVHPAHAESVAWVSGITDPLMSLFLLPAFWCYLRWRKGGRKYLFAGLIVFYFMALFGKETALALPLMIAWCELFHFKDLAPLKVRLMRAVGLPALLALPTAAYFGMRFFALRGVLFGSGQRYPLDWALMTIPLAILKYIKLMLLPWGHSYQHYTEFVGSIGSVEFLVPLALIAALIGAIALTRSRLLAWCAFWFVAMLTPALAAMRQFDREYLIQDRYLYLPSIGFCLALALLIDWSAKRYGFKAGAAVAAALIVIFGAANIRQNQMWKDGIILFENCVAADPNSAEAHVSLARAYFESGRVREGEEQANRGLELAPDSVSPYLVLSYFARASGKLDKSIEYLERGTSTATETPITRFKLATMYLNLGLLQSQAKNNADAERSMLRSLEIWPRATGLFYVGQFYFDQGRYEEALTMFEGALSTVPRRFAPIHLRLGWTYDKLGQTANARTEYLKYLELSPNASDAAEVNRRLSQLAL